MNQTQLKKLVGLTVAKAKKAIKAAGLVSRVYDENAIIISLSLPANVVKITKDENGIVTTAETQASIDAKYAK